jgi:hypothetical protein
MVAYVVGHMWSKQDNILNYLNNNSTNHLFLCLDATFYGQKEHSKELVTR